jgi:hypothetical protein
MQPGSLVVTVYNFDLERNAWPYPYPKKGDILTVKMMAKDPGPDLKLHNGQFIPFPRKKPIFDLWFEELNTIPLADKKVSGTPNFIEIQSPEEAMQILEEINTNHETTSTTID